MFFITHVSDELLLLNECTATLPLTVQSESKITPRTVES